MATVVQALDCSTPSFTMTRTEPFLLLRGDPNPSPGTFQYRCERNRQFRMVVPHCRRAGALTSLMPARTHRHNAPILGTDTLARRTVWDTAKNPLGRNHSLGNRMNHVGLDR
jgi:hypothetical protein